jgi:peptidylprolyl isomerase
MEPMSLEKPEIDFPTGDAPTELVITDVVVGDGAEAQATSTVDVHYVGVEYDTGRSSTRPGTADRRSTSRSSSSWPAGRKASPA